MAQPQHLSSSLASLSTVDQAQAELETRLISIHHDLQLTQTIGLLFVKRQEDLKNCFDQLQYLKDHGTSGQQESSLHPQREESGSASSVSSQGSDQQQQQPLPESLREQLALIDKEFQEGQNGILGLKGMIDAQLVCPISFYLLLLFAAGVFHFLFSIFFLLWWSKK